MSAYSPAEALALGAEEVAPLLGLPLSRARRLRETARGFDASRELEAAARLGVRLIAWDDPDYPRELLEIPEAPLLLYVQGRLTAEPAALACVGSRRPTPYGLRMARRLAADAAAAGLVVVSGLARGIDAQAHEAALDRGGRTWAVLGSGLEAIYPPEHEPLARRIVDSGGCLISEMPLTAAPTPEAFPRRNRIVAGLCWGTLVIEGRHRSGSLITAQFALQYGREVFAVPGPADSPLGEAPHHLLRGGATLTCSARDIFDALPQGLRPQPISESVVAAGVFPAAGGIGLASEYGKILELIGADSPRLDDLVGESGMDVSRLSHLLFEMELQGLVLPVPGQRYAKKEN